MTTPFSFFSCFSLNLTFEGYAPWTVDLTSYSLEDFVEVNKNHVCACVYVCMLTFDVKSQTWCGITMSLTCSYATTTVIVQYIYIHNASLPPKNVLFVHGY